MANPSGTSPVTATRLPHLDVLDGLRGVAILLVVAFHYFHFVPLFRIGWIGVDLFFVLSGFLITGKLVESLGRKHYFSVFYLNRALRLFPLYYAVLLIFFLAIFLWVSPENLPRLRPYTDHWISFVLFLQNWSFISHGFPKEVYLVHLWSVAVEEQFYLVWPLVLFFFRDRRKLVWCLLLWIMLVIAYRFYLCYGFSVPKDAIHNSICRSDSFLLGALAFFLYDKQTVISRKICSYLLAGSFLAILAGIALSGNLQHDNFFFASIGYTIDAVFFASTLLCCILYKGSAITAWLSNKILRYCGKISYGIYIFHLPVLLVVGTHLRNWITGQLQWSENAALIISLACSLVTCFLLSAVSYRYYESYFLALKKRST